MNFLKYMCVTVFCLIAINLTVFGCMRVFPNLTQDTCFLYLTTGMVAGLIAKDILHENEKQKKGDE